MSGRYCRIVTQFVKCALIIYNIDLTCIVFKSMIEDYQSGVTCNEVGGITSPSLIILRNRLPI